MTAAWLEQAEAEADALVQRFPDWEGFIELLVVPPTFDEVAEEFPEAARSSMKDYEDRLTSYGLPCLALYVKMRRTGKDHRFSEMVATQAGPVLSTDDTFFAGMGTLDNQFQSQKHLNRFLKAAKAHGYTPSPNDVYMPGLARFKGDPEAWVSRAQGRAYIRKLLEGRGYRCNSNLSNIESCEPSDDPLAPKNCKPLGEDIIRRRISEYQKADPSLRKKDRRELREMVIEKHAHKIH